MKKTELKSLIESVVKEQLKNRPGVTDGLREELSQFVQSIKDDYVYEDSQVPELVESLMEIIRPYLKSEMF